MEMDGSTVASFRFSLGILRRVQADLEARGLRPEHLEGVREIFDTYFRSMKELLQGMSETSGLSLEEHILLETSFYILPDLVIEQSKKAPSCSEYRVWPPRGLPTAAVFCAQLGHDVRPRCDLI